MARPRRVVIRAAVAKNRPVQPNPQGTGWKNPRGGPSAGVGQARAARPAAPRNPARPSRLRAAQGVTAGAQPASTAMPWDSQSTMEFAGGYRSAQDKLAGLRGNWDAEQRSIGLGAGYENNPYSQASLLVRQKEIGTRGINQRPGQLYSGATINHLGQVERGYNEGYGHLEENYEARKAQTEREELATQHEIETDREQAQLEAIRRAEEAVPPPAPVSEASEDEGGGDSGGGGGGGGGKKKAKPKTGVGKGHKAK